MKRQKRHTQGPMKGKAWEAWKVQRLALARLEAAPESRRLREAWGRACVAMDKARVKAKWKK